MGFIGIGQFSKYNIYILIGFLSEMFLDLMLGMNSSNKENPGKFFYFIPKFKYHSLIRSLLLFLSCLLGGIVLFILEKKNMNQKEGEITIGKNEKLRKKFLGEKNQNIYLGLFYMALLLSLNKIIKCFIDLFELYIGLWMFEIVYICILSYIILKTKINSHQKFAILFMVFPVLIVVIINYCLPISEKNCSIKDECNEISNKNTFETIKIRWGVYFIPLLIILNDLTNLLRDYSWVKSKYLMDIRSVPPFKIFLSIGIIGCTLVIILFAIFTNVPCNTYNNIILNEDGDYIYKDSRTKIDFLRELCKLKYYDKVKKKLYIYFDNFSVFIKDYGKDKESYLEIFLMMPLYLIICFILLFSHIMMIRHTDPNNILISKNLFYFFKRLINLIINKGNEKNSTFGYFLKFQIQELISIISNLIYIEVIELRFCKLDYQLKRNIKDRSDDDYSGKSNQLLNNETIRETQFFDEKHKEKEMQNLEKDE